MKRILSLCVWMTLSLIGNEALALEKFAPSNTPAPLPATSATTEKRTVEPSATTMVSTPAESSTAQMETPSAGSQTSSMPMKQGKFQTKPLLVPSPAVIAEPATDSAQRIVKKKIVVAAFGVKQPTQVQDIDDIAHGFSEQLSYQLNASRKFLSKASPYLLPLTSQDDFSALQMTRQMATSTDSQFVITGEILDTGGTVDKKLLGLLSIPHRHFEISLTILDGGTGMVLASHKLHQEVIEKTEIGRDKAFGSQAFLATPYGQAIGNVIAASVKLVAKDVDAIPMTAKIIKLSGTQVVIDAGGTSALIEGDVFAVYGMQSQLPEMGLMKASAPGGLVIPEKKLGHIVAKRIQAAFAVADVPSDANQIGLREGDIVRLQEVPK